MIYYCCDCKDHWGTDKKESICPQCNKDDIVLISIPVKNQKNMKYLKRKSNTTGLKVKYLTNSSSIRITQMNCKKSIIIPDNTGMEIIDFICLKLDNIQEIENYSILVDNTQNNYYIFNLNFRGNSFNNLLKHFK